MFMAEFIKNFKGFLFFFQQVKEIVEEGIRESRTAWVTTFYKKYERVIFVRLRVHVFEQRAAL